MNLRKEKLYSDLLRVLSHPLCVATADAVKLQVTGESSSFRCSNEIVARMGHRKQRLGIEGCGQWTIPDTKIR